MEGAGIRSWCYLARHLRADATDNPAASVRLANFAPDRLAPSWPHKRLSASAGYGYDVAARRRAGE
jgi:hypothetical protein